MKTFFVLLGLSFLFTSCQTTEEIQAEQKLDNLSLQVIQGQRLSADSLVRLQNMENRINQLSGAIEERDKSTEDSKESFESLQSRLLQVEEVIGEQKKVIEELKIQVQEQKSFIREVTSTLKKITKNGGRKKTSQSQKLSFTKAIKNYRAKRYKVAKNQFLGLLTSKSLTKEQTAHTLHNLGLLSFMEKNYDDTLTYLSRLYTSYPKSKFNARGLLILGQTFQRKKQSSDARSSFEQLIATFPKSQSAKKARALLGQMKK